MRTLFPDIDPICGNCLKWIDPWFKTAREGKSVDYFTYREIALSKLQPSDLLKEITSRIDKQCGHRDEELESEREANIRQKRDRTNAAREIQEKSASAIKQLDESRSASFNSKLDALRAQGYDGYWEYYVLSLVDENGAISPETLTLRLNELGLLGWHLKCAYANELGHNTSSVGMFGISSGTNVTVDQNVLILERFVKI